MKLGELRVDFMPDDAKVLTFTNRWYADALISAQSIELDEQTTIRLVQPPYFIATKLEAYHQRGNDDPLGSQDIEDILSLFDGRPELVEELEHATPELLEYVRAQLRELLEHSDFDYAVQSASCGSPDREKLIWERIKRITRSVI
ncbi:hypothetical protein [Cupriavidus necator]